MELTTTIVNGFFQGIVFYPLVLSLALSYRLLRFPDITVEGTFTLGASVFSIMLVATDLKSYSLLVSLMMTAIAGAVTAILHHYVRVNKFLAGIIVVTALYSINIRFMGGSNASLLRFSLASDNFLLLSGICTVVVSLLAVLFYRSGFGIRVRGAAINPLLSDGLGYKTGLLVVCGLAFNNAIAGVSGVLFSMDAGFVDVKMGNGTLIVALAALAIGERLMPQGKSSVLSYVVLSAFIGSVGYQMLWAFALKLDIRPSDLKILSALIVVSLFLIKRKLQTGDEL